MTRKTSRKERREQLRNEIEPLECDEGHDTVEMEIQAEFGSTVRYECPDCSHTTQYVMKFWDGDYREIPSRTVE